MVKEPLYLDGIVVDIGNTDYKYALISRGQIYAVHRSRTAPAFGRYTAPVIGSCVVPRRARRLEQHRQIRWIEHADIPIVAPSHVGIDRLVALYAANVLYGEGTVLVVDVGTFLTLSILHQQEFVGGYIIPGPQTMMDSYGVGAQLPSKQSWRRSGYFEWSKDTVMAMQNGTTETLIRGVTSIIKEIMTRFPGVLVVGTGGAATSLLTPIHEVVLINPTLVLEGLVSLAQTKDLF